MDRWDVELIKPPHSIDVSTEDTSRRTDGDDGSYSDLVFSGRQPHRL